jgi:undecaprenyl-diphosphatase
MSIVPLLLLGLIQGLTEFLPISSDGHLSLALLFLPSTGGSALPLETALHGGTLLAVMVWFRRELAAVVSEGAALLRGVRPQPGGLLVPVLIGSIPTAVIGLALRDTVEGAIASRAVILSCMAVTALLLAASDRVSGEGAAGRDLVSWRQALLIGAAQGLAVLPGLSRSGATIAVALFAGVRRETAFTYSFVLSVPAVFGALLLEARGAELPPLWPIGVAVAAATGLAALTLLRPLVQRRRLTLFSVYLALLILAVALLGRS